MIDDHGGPARSAVAGYFEDSLQGLKACLVLEPGEPNWTGQDYVEFAREHYSDANVVITRHPDQHAQLDGFRDYLYYIRLDHRPARNSQDPSITARRASTPEDASFVTSLLVEAFEDAVAVSNVSESSGAASAQAEAIMAMPETVSFVVEQAGQPFGHATLLVGQVDDVTEEEFVEFLDMLVMPTHEKRRAAEVLLVQVAQEFAAAQGQPLVGHVVVRSDGSGYEVSLLERLAAQGWEFSHKFMISRGR